MPGAVLGGILIGVLETLFSGYVHVVLKILYPLLY